MKAYVVFVAVAAAAAVGYAVPERPEGTYAALPLGYEIDWDSLKLWAQIGFGILAAVASANPKVKAIYDKLAGVLSAIPGLGFLFDKQGPEAEVERILTDTLSLIKRLRELNEAKPTASTAAALLAAQEVAKSTVEELIQ